MGERQGPSESASLFPTDDSKFGNDSQIWTVKSFGRTKRWTRQTKLVEIKGSRAASDQNLPNSPKPFTNSYYPASRMTVSKKYYVHDNGGRPFMVIVTNNEISVLAGIYDYACCSWTYKAPVLKISNYAGYWVGTNNTHYLGAKWARGNSILVKVKSHSYIEIGSDIYQFETNDEIYDYFSEIGNNDVPYPIALGTENTYFMVDYHYVPNSQIKMEITYDNVEKGRLMGYYYGHIDRQGRQFTSFVRGKYKTNKDAIKDDFKKFRLKKFRTLTKRNLSSVNFDIAYDNKKSIKKRKSKSKKK